MEFPIKILNQLRPILRGFRKAQKLTQADIAKRLGITQQSYAQLEANPAAASLERLFKVLAILQVDVVLKERDGADTIVKVTGGLTSVNRSELVDITHLPSVHSIHTAINQVDLEPSKAFDDMTNELSLAFSSLKKKR